MKKVFIFDFDGTFYSGEHKFDHVKNDIENNRRKFLGNLNDEEYYKICEENPKWEKCITGNDIVRNLLKLMKLYPDKNISIDEFYNWQNDFIYDIVLDYNQVINKKFIKDLASKYPVYVVSNSSLKHIYYYMDQIDVDPTWFKKVIGNEFKPEDPSKEHYYKDILEENSDVPNHDFYVFGDSVDSDLAPAIHLGMNAFYVSNSSNIAKVVETVIESES